MVLYGTRGTGKTQIASVATVRTIERNKPARMVTAAELVSDLKRRYDQEGDALADWLGEWGWQHLLVIDEINQRFGTDHEMVALTTLTDRRYANERPTLLIGNVTAKDLAGCLGSSVLDRCLEGGGTLCFDGLPSFRGR